MKRPYAAYTAAPTGAAAPPAAGAAPATPYANYGYGAPGQAKAQPAAAPTADSGLTKEQQQAQWHAQWQQYYAQQAAAAAQGGAAAAPPTNAGPMQPQYAQPAMQAQPQQAPPQQQPQQQQQPYYAQFPQQPPAVQQQQQPQTPSQAPVYTQPSPILQPPQAFAQQQQQPQAMHYSGAQAGAYTAATQQPAAYYPQTPGQFQPAPQPQQQQAPSGPPQKRARYDGIQQPQQQQQQWQQPQQQSFVPQSPMAPNAQPQPQMNFQQPQQQQQSFGWQGVNSPPSGPAQGIGRGGAPAMRGGATGYSGPPPQQNFRAPSGPAAGRGGVPFSPARATSGQFGGNAPSGPAGASPHNNNNNAGRFNGPVGVNAMAPAGQNGAMATRGGANAGAARGGRGGHTAGFAGRGGLSSQNSIAAASPRNFGGQQRGGHAARGGPAAGRGGNHGQTAVFEQSRAAVIAARAAPSTIADQPVSINAKRTYTEFKIKSLEIPGIDWSWSIFDGISDQDDDEEEAADADAAKSVTGGEASPAKGKAGKRAIPTGPRSNVPAKETPAKNKNDVCRMRINFAAATLAPPVGAPTGPKAGIVKTDKGAQAAPADPAQPAAVAVTATAVAAPAAKASGSKSKVEAATNTEEDNAMSVDAAAPSGSTDVTMINGDISIESLSPENVAFGQALKMPTPVPDVLAWSAWSKGPPQCSMNRVGISYASGRRRLTIDAETVRALRVYRAEARAELVLDVVTAPSTRRAADKLKKGQEWVIIKGLLLETRSGENDSFAVVPRRQLEHAWAHQTFGLTEAEKKEALAKAAEEEGANGEGGASSDDAKSPATDADAEAVVTGSPGKKAAKDKLAEAEDDVIPGSYAELPPFFRVLSKHDGPADEQTYAARGASELVIKIAFDRLASPMEEKWLKTGDVSEWLSALPAFSSRLSQQAWQGKIHVVDPDPPPSMRDVCEAWAAQSLMGAPKDRRRFVAEQLADATGQSQLLARLVRDDKAFVTKLNARDLTAPLVEAAEQSRYGFAHTHLELAVLALYGAANKYATAAGEASALEAQLDEMLMSMPQNLTFKALDGLFKIYSTEQAEKQRVQVKEDKKKVEKAEKAAKKTKKQAATTSTTTASASGKDGAQTTSKSTADDSAVAASAQVATDVAAAAAGEASTAVVEQQQQQVAGATAGEAIDVDDLATPEAEEPAAVEEAVDDALAQEVADAIMQAAVPVDQTLQESVAAAILQIDEESSL